MGLVGNLLSSNAEGKTKTKKKKPLLRRLFWRLKASVKKNAARCGIPKRNITFQYDPSSYALNFDDGTGHDDDIATPKPHSLVPLPLQCSSDTTKTIQWVYVIWVKSD